MNTRRFFRLPCAVLSVLALAVFFSSSAQAKTEAPFYQFTGGFKGGYPYGGVVVDVAGNIYGTAYYFGLPNLCQGTGCGVVYKITPLGVQTVLHAFTGGHDGANPASTLMLDAAGNLYGTTTRGGNLAKCFGFGCGVVFKLSPNSSGPWTETVLYAFSGGFDGTTPNGDLSMDSAGNIYGTTGAGGNTALVSAGLGVVFELSPTSGGKWKETVLHAFTGVDGAAPQAGVILDAAGNLYGTTFNGGLAYGVVYRIAPASSAPWPETVLYRFQGTIAGDGEDPVSRLVFDAAGNLYGTTRGGGSDGLGTVFELSPTSGTGWRESHRHSFSNVSGGCIPEAGVVFDSVGNIWGTNSGGGGAGVGSLFEITVGSSGQWTVSDAYDFFGADGSQPIAALAAAPNGLLYGTTVIGGPFPGGFGVVFQVAP